MKPDVAQEYEDLINDPKLGNKETIKSSDGEWKDPKKDELPNINSSRKSFGEVELK